MEHFYFWDIFYYTDNSEKEICLGECIKVVPQQREDLGVLCVSKTMNHQGMPKCEPDEFMVKASIKDEFDAYVRNADLEDFLQDKCPQYYQLIDSFIRRFKYKSSRNSQSVLFDIYDKSYTMDLEDFTTACKLPQWGNVNDPHRSEYKDFLASITVG